MEVVITASPHAAGQVAADAIQRLLVGSTTPVLGLATGSSPLPIYRELIRRHQERGLSFATTTVFLLDEYVGSGPGRFDANRAFIQRELTAHVDLPRGALHGPDGAISNLDTAGATYELLLSDAGGIDLQILGIGSDGHIGFNEPGSSLASRTRLKTLTTETRNDNARFFGGQAEDVPRHVVTQGIGTVLDARHLILIATGEHKAEPVAKAIEGPVTAMVPASALQLHPHVTAIVDEPAASLLRRSTYYRDAFDHKPEWQHI